MRITTARIGLDETPVTFTKAFAVKHPNYEIKDNFKSFKKLKKIKKVSTFQTKFDEYVGDYFNQITLVGKDKKRENAFYIFNVSPIDITLLLLQRCQELPEYFVNKQLVIIKQLYSYFDIIFAFPATKFSGNLAFKEDPAYSLFLMFIKKYYEDSFGYVPANDKPTVIEMYGGPDEMMAIVDLYIAKDGGFIAEGETVFSKEVANLDQDYA